VWGSAVDGRTLTFRLIGINNQNFVMQDEETGTWWQQVSGEAIHGPLKGQKLTLIPADQLTFETWRSESPRGRVLVPEEAIVRDGGYAPVDWEVRMQRNPPPASAAADTRLPARALVIGVELNGASRAYPVEAVNASRILLDDLGGRAIAIVRAPDGRSTRVFDRTVDGAALEFAARPGDAPFRFFDTRTASEWDFTGTAVAGPYAGRVLARLPYLEEFWFDWKTYHPATDIARR
jgi:hypothetical protein